jgi:hypothetical protein
VNSLVGEPILDDRRMARIQGRVRREHRDLPEAAVFHAFKQEETWGNSGGVMRPVAPRAVFLIEVVCPGDENKKEWLAAHAPYSEWLKWEFSDRHNGDVDSDIAYHAFSQLAVNAIDWLRARRAEMN